MTLLMTAREEALVLELKENLRRAKISEYQLTCSPYHLPRKARGATARRESLEREVLRVINRQYRRLELYTSFLQEGRSDVQARRLAIIAESAEFNGRNN